MKDPKDAGHERTIVSSMLSDLAPVARDWAEIGIDTLIENDDLKSIPVIGTAVVLLNGGQNVRQRMYIRKMVQFLANIEKASAEEREYFVQTTLSSARERDRFSELVVHLVDSAESVRRADLYGNIMLDHVKGNLDYEVAIRLCLMCEKTMMEDLVEMPTFNTAENVNNLLADALYRSGFLEFAGIDGGTFGAIGHEREGGLVYRINWYGQQLVRVLTEMQQKVDQT